jgi:hypothetical protein
MLASCDRMCVAKGHDSTAREVDRPPKSSAYDPVRLANLIKRLTVVNGPGGKFVFFFTKSLSGHKPALSNALPDLLTGPPWRDFAPPGLPGVVKPG